LKLAARRRAIHSGASALMNRFLAIVPAYNESEIIARTVEEIHDCAPDFDVLVVDDGSSDQTAANATAAGARVLRLPFNVGIGGAMQSGYIYALERGYQIAVQVDGDGQHDPRHIHELLHHLQENPGCNMVTGSRFLEPRDGGDRSSAPRRVGIAIFARVVSLVTGQRVTDPTSGFRMIDRLGIELFARDYPQDYPEIEAILLLHAHRLHSRELPVRMRPRTSGMSSISSVQPIYYMVKVLLAIFVTLFRARPQLKEPDPQPIGAERVPS
jgi:hypothetical protein